MRIELWILLIAGAVMANIYTEGRILRRILDNKKYIQMAGVGIGALVLYYLFKKNPGNVHQMVYTANEYMKYLPVDKNTSSMLTPILDFTSRFKGSGEYGEILDMNGTSGGGGAMASEQRGAPMPSVDGMGRRMATKRSVSEAKKKFVAASQGWKCVMCSQQLPFTYEVDHIVRLEFGGSNNTENLQALCPGCHREKTAMEKMF